ncbi:MAG: DUF4013 domain-containing protein [Chloroflexi bacterium]|nr:DUF4013 domain-containing protein [Chloroflexota bacterium]
MDVGKSFTYMFEDKDWIAKIAIGGLILLAGALFSWLLLVPLIAAIGLVFGYALVTLRNVYDGNPTPLPKWENLGDLFVKGITAMIGLFIWSIPALILFCCAYIPFILAGAGNDGGGNAASGLLGLVGALFFCIAFVVAIAISLFTFAPLTNFALNNQLSTFWDFGGNWKFIQANVGDYLIAWLLGNIVAGIIASVVSSISCGLLSVFAIVWSYLVMAHLFAQVARSNLTPTDSSMLPPTPPTDEPPSMMQGPMEPSPSA